MNFPVTRDNNDLIDFANKYRWTMTISSREKHSWWVWSELLENVGWAEMHLSRCACARARTRLSKGGRAVRARSEKREGERATRNRRGVEFRGYRRERERGMGKKGEGNRQWGTGVTAILYLARRDRVNELRLRGGPTAGNSFPFSPLFLLFLHITDPIERNCYHLQSMDDWVLNEILSLSLLFLNESLLIFITFIYEKNIG